MAELIKVVRRKGEDINKLIKRWKNKFEEAEIKQELVSRKEYIKPSLQKRKQKQEAVRNNQREVELYKKENAIK